MMQWALSKTSSQVDASPRSGADATRDAYSQDLNRMLTAAVVSRRFRNQLLADPQSALRGGYNGESFDLSESEQDAVLAIQATDLRDFAAQLVAEMDESGWAEPGPYAPQRAHRSEAVTGVAHYA